jgi:phosphatidylglycerol:prolipoprotein diacylglycerol transferase
MYPVLFEIPLVGWPIFSYGVMLGLSMIAGWYFVLGLAERDGFSRQEMANGFVYSVIAALVGARLLYIIVNPDQFHAFGDLLNVRQGGLVAYGGFLGGVLASWVYCWRKKVSILAWADTAVPSLALGLFVTRIGCFLYGCDYGRRVTDDDPGWLRSIAMRFPNWEERFPELASGAGGACEQDLHGAPAFAHHVSEYGLEPTAAESFAVVPTQLLSSLNGLILLGVVMAARRWRKFRGQALLAFGLYYGLSRFFLEIVRDDNQRGTLGPPFLGPFGGLNGHLTTSQLIAVFTAVACIVGWIYLARKAKADPEAAMSLGPGAEKWKKEKEGKERKGRRRPGRKRKGK